jgi:hypothetical protein
VVEFDAYNQPRKKRKYNRSTPEQLADKRRKCDIIDPLVVAYQKNPCDETWLPVMEHMREAVGYVIKKLKIPRRYYADAWAIGIFRLWVAAQPGHWMQGPGCYTFSAYATRAVEWGIVRALKRTMQADAYEKPIAKMIVEYDDGLDVVEALDAADELHNLEVCIHELPEWPRFVMRHYLAGWNLKEIADKEIRPLSWAKENFSIAMVILRRLLIP